MRVQSIIVTTDLSSLMLVKKPNCPWMHQSQISDCVISADLSCCFQPEHHRWSGTGRTSTCWHPVTMETSGSGTKEWAVCVSDLCMCLCLCYKHWCDLGTEAKHSGGVRCSSPLEDPRPWLASRQRIHLRHIKPGQLSEGEMRHLNTMFRVKGQPGFMRKFFFR